MILNMFFPSHAFDSFFRSKHYVGKISNGFYDDRFGHLLVGTEENVIAALNVENGDIVWRRVLETGDRGSIQHLQFLSEEVFNPNSLRVSGRQEPDRFMVTVTGTNFLLVRVWNIRTGNLAWEWNIQLNSATNEKPHWFSTPSTLYHVQPDWKSSNVEIIAYNIKTGQIESTTRKIPVGTSQKQSCDFVQTFLVCSIGGEVVATDLLTSTKKIVAKASSGYKVIDVSVSK